jgi:hypothetical protein
VPLRRITVATAVLLLFGCTAPTAPGAPGDSIAQESAGFNHDAYRASTITAAVQANPSASPRGVVTIEPVVKYRFRVRFSGEVQAVRPEIRNVIELWAGNVGARSEFINLFQNEITVEEAGVRYRLPVQQQVLGFFPEEVSRGTSIELFAMLVGITQGEHVFLVNEFSAGGPSL